MKILAYPYNQENPYQSLLYHAMFVHRLGHQLTYLKNSRLGLVLMPLLLIKYRLAGYRIFHLHWLSFSVSMPLPGRKQLSYGYSLLCLYAIKLLGYQLVWTVHNVVPHEAQTTDDLALMRLLSRIADAKIIHSRYTLQQMQEYGLDTSNTTVIPHGNYIGVYPKTITALEARQKLGISKDEVVILFFGLVRPYKGIEDLLDAFTKLKLPGVRLLIAGKCIDERLKCSVTEATRHANVSFYDGYVERNDVAAYFVACDMVCLPFQAITTSGSTLLALSFGKPIIAPRSGALLDLPTNVGYLYNPQKPAALAGSLKRAIKQKDELGKLGVSAYEYAQTLSWSQIASATYSVYQEVLERTRPSMEVKS